MSRRTKWMVAAVLLLVIGAAVCAAAYAASGFSFGKFSTVAYVTNTYEVSGRFENIRVLASTEEITLVPSDDGTCKVVCREEENDPHSVTVRGGTLTIEKTKKSGGWSLHVGVVTESPAITVFLPGETYGALTVDSDTGDVSIPADFSFDSIRVSLNTGRVQCFASTKGEVVITTDTGDIAVSGLSAAVMRLDTDTGRIKVSDAAVEGDLEIRVSTGRATLENVRCGNLSSEGNSGSLVMTKVVASGTFELRRDTGDIRLDGCDAERISIRTDTGDVSGTLLSDKIFLAKSDTGKVRTPGTTEGGSCEITTDTGDITITIAAG